MDEVHSHSFLTDDMFESSKEGMNTLISDVIEKLNMRYTGEYVNSIDFKLGNDPIDQALMKMCIQEIVSPLRIFQLKGMDAIKNRIVEHEKNRIRDLRRGITDSEKKESLKKWNEYFRGKSLPEADDLTDAKTKCKDIPSEDYRKIAAEIRKTRFDILLQAQNMEILITEGTVKAALRESQAIGI